jgi:hypothetical protein
MAEDNANQALKGPINTGATGDFGKKAATPSLAGAVLPVELLVERKDVVIKGKHGLRIQVKNNSDQALVFCGERATATIGKTVFNCLDTKNFDELISAPPGNAVNWSIGLGETLAEALTMGGWQAVADMRTSTSPGLKRYGKDEERREQAAERFGQRLIYPGESSSGILLFSCDQSLQEAAVTLPVSSCVNSNEQSVISNSPPAP